MVSKTRDTLLAAAAQLLDEGGPEAVTLREVGHRAGVSHNAPYKHFADKEALLAAVAARELDRSSSALSATVAGLRPPGAAVQAVMRGYVAWAMEFPQRFKLVYGSWSKGSDELAAAAGSARALFTGVVTAAQRTRPASGRRPRTAGLAAAGAHPRRRRSRPGGRPLAHGKGRATPAELADDCSATSVPPPGGRPALATTERRRPGRPGPARGSLTRHGQQRLADRLLGLDGRVRPGRLGQLELLADDRPKPPPPPRPAPSWPAPLVPPGSRPRRPAR